MKMKWKLFALALILMGMPGVAADFEYSWNGLPDSRWVGSAFWVNRLQDWRVSDQRLECIPNRNLPMRTLALLSHDLGADGDAFQLSVDLGLTDPNAPASKDTASGAAGFLLGVGNGEMDYRGAALIHQVHGKGTGIFVGIDRQGRVRIHDNETGHYFESEDIAASEQPQEPIDLDRVHLECSAEAQAAAQEWKIKVRAKDADGRLLGEASGTVPATRMRGNIGLMADPGLQKDAIVGYWFDNLAGSGDKLARHLDRSFGPVMGTLYTVHRGTLKINAQMAPLPESRLKDARLEIQDDGKWKTVALANVDPQSFTALFRVEGWDDTEDTPYRVSAPGMLPGEQTWDGTIRHNPRETDEFVVAAFTGNHNISHRLGCRNRYRKDRPLQDWINYTWFPHAHLVDSVSAQKPDLLFFSGDQVYESDSPSYPDSAARELDYLYKWYLYIWAFRDLTRDIPTVCIPDDHDVYQGNLWGQGGRKAKRQNEGGYVCPAEFVKMVERTQTSNLPDPYDPTPVEQGIGVYYTGLNWGPVSFAVIEDRKFKSGKSCQEVLEGGYDDPRLVLLGDRQIEFLEDWVGDWGDGAAMKASLNATVFAQLHTWREKDGSIEQDTDSNGFPVKGRNRALRALRKGFTLMIGGDQHLATTAHHGVDEFGDSGWSICVPSIANFFPRSWKPIEEGLNRLPGQGPAFGDHFDGWGNKVTMLAFANPGKKMGREPAELHDGMAGYGIVRFKQNTREISMENWPRYASRGNGSPYDGWPVKVPQASNYARQPTAWLPEIVSGIANPVVKVYKKHDGELVYALRIKGNRFQPGVFADGEYEVKVGEPDKDQWKSETFKSSSSRDLPPFKVF